MVKKRCTFKNLKKPGRNSKNSKNLEEIQKTWRKIPKNLWPPCFYHFRYVLAYYLEVVRYAVNIDGFGIRLGEGAVGLYYCLF